MQTILPRNVKTIAYICVLMAVSVTATAEAEKVAMETHCPTENRPNRCVNESCRAAGNDSNPDTRRINATVIQEADCQPANCTANGVCHYDKPKGCIRLSAKNSGLTTHLIELRNESSVIRLQLRVANCSLPDVNTTVEISDGEANATQTWVVDSRSSGTEFRYLSLFPVIRMDVKPTGKWCQLVFNYEEITFEMYTEVRQEDSGVISSSRVADDFFRPNSAYIYRLVPAPGAWNKSSVTVTVKTLSMAKSSGSYVLIGAGSTAFSGPPAAHLSGNVKGVKKYYVAADNAYVVFFKASSEEKFRFHFTWVRSGDQISKPVEKPEDKSVPDSLLQAVPVCFYNASWITQFNQTKEAMDMFLKFQAKFAETANRYIKSKGVKYMHEISPQSVQLLQISSVLPPSDDIDDLENGAVYAIIGIVQPYDSRVSMFKWKEMSEILEEFDAYDEANEHELFGFKVGKCPDGIDYKTWYYATALVALICAAVFLTIWLCFCNTTRKLQKYRDNLKKLPEKLNRLQSQRKHAGKEYVAYDNHAFEPPKITVTTEQGTGAAASRLATRRYTSIISDEDSDEEIFAENWMRKRPSFRNFSGTDGIYDPAIMKVRKMYMFDIPLQNNRNDRPTQPSPVDGNSTTENVATTSQYIFDKPLEAENVSAKDTDTKL